LAIAPPPTPALAPSDVYLARLEQYRADAQARYAAGTYTPSEYDYHIGRYEFGLTEVAEMRRLEGGLPPTATPPTPALAPSDVVAYTTPAGDVVMISQAQADSLAAQLQAEAAARQAEWDRVNALPTEEDTRVVERPAIPPNTYGQQMVLVYDPRQNNWAYITLNEATFLQSQGGSPWEFHGVVNPVVTKASLQAVPLVISPGSQWQSFSLEHAEVVELAMARYSLEINYQNNLRWASGYADPYYMPGGAGYPGYDVRNDPQYNGFLAEAEQYRQALADNLAHRQAIIDAAY
jgi:hypothetical protein